MKLSKTTKQEPVDANQSNGKKTHTHFPYYVSGLNVKRLNVNIPRESVHEEKTKIQASVLPASAK